MALPAFCPAQEKACEERVERSGGAKALAAGGVAFGVGALVAMLLGPRPAGAAPGQPTEVIVDGDVRKALAALLLQGQDIAGKLDTANETLKSILAALGAQPGEELILEPFQKINQALAPGESLPLYESKPGKGALIWAVVDVTDPNTSVIFKFDDLTWELNYTTLFNEGVDRPLFPGIWLARYDALTLHYSLVFSAGDVKGWAFSKLAQVVVRFNGVPGATATLTEGRGVVWTHV